uniref:Xylulose kinase-1 n=1 Tax=Tanacetum cinerariifolium TaxID=118510 RepID=A0A699GTX0_TANCI|nr:hypothetical protein [Tanacetum cinerariifolium]
MVAFLTKPQGIEDFHQILDFLNASHIRYALTENPTIYVSLINQFWHTASAKTLGNGEIELNAIVDGQDKTITEASVRRHLKLADADGIRTLPITKIFEQLTIMGYGEGPTSPVGTQHTPTVIETSPQLQNISNTYRKTRTRTRRIGIRIPQSNIPISVADEAITKEMHDGLGRATTTSSSLEAEQGSSNISKTQTKVTLSGLSFPRTSSEGGLGCHVTMGVFLFKPGLKGYLTCLMNHHSKKVTTLENELKSTKAVYNKALITLTKRVKKLEKKLKYKRKREVVDSSEDEKASLDKEDSPKYGSMIEEINEDENVNLVKSNDDEITLAKTLVNIKKSAAKDKGKAIMQESEPLKKIKKKEMIQISLDEEIAQSIRKFIPMESEGQIAYSKAGEEGSKEGESLKRHAEEELGHVQQKKQKRRFGEIMMFSQGKKFESFKLIWRLYDWCGVHHISTRDGQDIFMLVEKEYTLSRGALLMTLVQKLQVDEQNEMAEELLRKIFMQAERPRKPSLNRTTPMVTWHPRPPSKLVLGELSPDGVALVWVLDMLPLPYSAFKLEAVVVALPNPLCVGYILELWRCFNDKGDDEVESPLEIERKTVKPSVDKIEVDIPKQNDKPTRRLVKYAEMYITQRPKGNHRNLNNLKSHQLGSNFVMSTKLVMPVEVLIICKLGANTIRGKGCKPSDASPVKIEAPKELPKVSLVNESLKFYLARFDNVVKIRTTPDARTEGVWGFEHTKAVFNDEIIPFLKSLKDIFNVFDKDLLNEIMKVRAVFDQMDADIQQSSVDKQCLEIAKK